MTRHEELTKIVGDNVVLTPLVDEVIFLEEKLKYYKTLPFIRVNPNNPEQQKSTPAHKAYKELLQQYTNCIKVLDKAVNGNHDADEDTPLREFARDILGAEGGYAEFIKSRGL